MAVRNGEAFVREAIESVLSQSVTDFEFLIVDDASTDDTQGILASYQRQDPRVHLLRNEQNLGAYPSANRALRQARGVYVARHDADDISPPDRFAVQLAALDAHEDTSLVTGAVEVFDEKNRRLTIIDRPPSGQPRLEWDLLFANAVGAGAHVMFPRVFRGAPVLYPTKYAYAEDYGLWCSLSLRGRVSCPSAVVYRYRQHDSSISGTKKAEQDECFSFLRHEYQSLYFRTKVTRDASAALSRFWTADGSRPLSEGLDRIGAMIAELTANFLTYVEQRYGPSERAAFERELDDTLGDRLGYWLYRSIRFLDGRACGEIIALAGARGVSMSVSGKAFDQAASAVLRRFRRVQDAGRQALGDTPVASDSRSSR